MAVALAGLSSVVLVLALLLSQEGTGVGRGATRTPAFRQAMVAAAAPVKSTDGVPVVHQQAMKLVRLEGNPFGAKCLDGR